MDKQDADRIIGEYISKLFGFALSKMKEISKAEELASAITLDVYSVLLTRDDINNLDGYIYRIAENVYSRHIAGYIKKSCLPLDGVDVPVLHDFTEDIEKSEEGVKLRQEIAYLSAVQRRIVWLHYYENKRLAEIAALTDIPVGTVKWHLYEAEQSLKEGMITVRESGTLSINPIHFTGMGHSGSPGSKGDTADFLKRRLTQNIAYAAYWNPKTTNEIAAELGVSPVFVEEEVDVLEEYGFMDKVGKDKYLTNIFITEPTQQSVERGDMLYDKAAGIVCEKYIPTLVEFISGMDKGELYIPDGDVNLLLWSAITAACGYRLTRNAGINSYSYSVKRKDGGDYIAFASIYANIKVSYDYRLYSACGDMTRDSVKDYPVRAWQLNTYYDSREGGWRENLSTDYNYLYEFMSGSLKKEDNQIEKFRRLYDKGYLRKESDTVNLIVIRDSVGACVPNTSFIESMPGLTEELLSISQTLDEEMYAIHRDLYPEHMRGLCKACSVNTISTNEVRIRVLEKLLKNEVLALPREEQKSGLNTLMFCDILYKH